MKKTLCITLCVMLMLSVLCVPAAAAGNSNKMAVRPAQYTSEGPNSGSSTVIYQQGFDGVSSPEAAGYFPAYVEDKLTIDGKEVGYCIPACDVSISSKHAHSGGNALLVSNRQKVYAKVSKSGKAKQLDHTGGEFSFVMTNNYYKAGPAAPQDLTYVDANGKAVTGYEWVGDGVGSVDLGSLIANSCGDVTKKENVSYFFQMWVYTETAQTFLPKFQYMGSNELWIPADDYWDVPANTWTLIGGYVDNGKTYYTSMVGEGGMEAYGLYGAVATTTESKFLIATKSKDATGNVTFTNGDFWVDDIALWKVSDKAKMYDMEYTLTNGQTYTGLDGLVKIENKDNIKSKKLVNAFGIKETKKDTPKATQKPGNKETKKTAAPTKVVKVTNKKGEVVGTKKVTVTATGTGTGTGTEVTATGTEVTGTGTELATATEPAAVTTTTKVDGEPEEKEESGSLLWLWIVLGVVVVGGGVAAGVVLSKKKKA